jgi:hypothetical protein
MIRFLCPGALVFLKEKVKREITVIWFLEHFTNIWIPHVLHYGMTEESPCGLGPFIIMEYIDHESTSLMRSTYPVVRAKRGHS